MPTKIFVNLPVKNLEKSKDFYTRLGFSINPQFTDETAACVVLSETIFAMILTHDKFKQFTKKDIADAQKTTEVLIAIDAESKAALQDMVNKATQAGGSLYDDAKDHGWMYQHSFADPDGHQWEVIYMDMNAIPQG